MSHSLGRVWGVVCRGEAQRRAAQRRAGQGNFAVLFPRPLAGDAWKGSGSDWDVILDVIAWAWFMQMRVA